MNVRNFTSKVSLLFGLVFICSGSFLKARSYSLSWDGEPMEDEATVIGEPSAFELGFSVQITNNSENIDTIRVERTLISLFEGASHYFCRGTSCYPPNPDSIYISSLSLILQPGKTSGLYVFAAFALPNETIGNSIVCYTFFNENDVDENISITVNYNTSVTSVNKPGFLKK